MNKTYCLEISGDFACFTRPEMKVERVSYPFITPSAARSIFEAIHWKPAMKWSISQIEVLNSIKWATLRQNEVKGKASRSGEPIIIEEQRQQRSSMLLKDVRYRIHGQFQMTDLAGDRDNVIKMHEIFLRRARNGQMFKPPYLGIREYAANWKYIDNPEAETTRPISESQDFGLVLYDKNYSNPERITPMFFHAKMENGVIMVPAMDSMEVLK